MVGHSLYGKQSKKKAIQRNRFVEGAVLDRDVKNLSSNVIWFKQHCETSRRYRSGTDFNKSGEKPFGEHDPPRIRDDAVKSRDYWLNMTIESSTLDDKTRGDAREPTLSQRIPWGPQALCPEFTTYWRRAEFGSSLRFVVFTPLSNARGTEKWYFWSQCYEMLGWADHFPLWTKQSLSSTSVLLVFCLTSWGRRGCHD